MAGASHILVISGMHMSIVTQFALGGLCLLGVRRRYAAGISIAFILAFMVVSGMSATVVRSGIMQIILLCGVLIGRTADALNSLAVAILFLALTNPFCAGDVSLLLSFSATLGIIALSPRMMDVLTGRIQSVQRRQFLTRILSPAAASVCAILGSLPVQLYVFGSINLAAVLTSVLALYASAWLIRFGVLAAILLSFPVLAPAAAPFVFLSGLLAKYQNAVVRLIAGALPDTLCIAGLYAAPAVLICVVFLLCGFRILRGRHIAAAYALAAGVLLVGMGANAALNSHGARLLVFTTPTAACTAYIENSAAYIFSCTGSSTAVGSALRDYGAERIALLHVQSDEKSIRCAQALAEEFRVSTVLYPDSVYFPVESDTQGIAYAYGTDGQISDTAAYSVSGRGDCIELSAGGLQILLEGGDGRFFGETADICVTDKAGGVPNGALTILQTEDTRQTAGVLPTGRYILAGEHEHICLRFAGDGSYTIYGG